MRMKTYVYLANECTRELKGISFRYGFMIIYTPVTVKVVE